MNEEARSWAAPVDDVKRGRELATAEGAHEFGIDLRVVFEPGGDIGPCRYLDFADKMPQRRRAEPMQMLDEALSPEPRA